jgi:hypothetical protein
LAKKLKDCGVFGVSSDEYLVYASENQQEWEHWGEEVVTSMVKKFKVEAPFLPEVGKDVFSVMEAHDEADEKSEADFGQG